MAGTLNCDVLLPPATEGVGGGGGSEEEEGVEAEFSPPWSVVDDLSVLVADSSRSLDWSCWVTTWSVRRNQADPSSDEAAMVLRLSRNFDTRSYKQWNNGMDTKLSLRSLSWRKLLDHSCSLTSFSSYIFFSRIFNTSNFCFFFRFFLFRMNSTSNFLGISPSQTFSAPNFLCV